MKTLRKWRVMWTAAVLALAVGEIAAVHAAGPNAFEFRRPSDNTSKAILDNNGNVIFQGSGTFQATGNGQYSIETSSGIKLDAGGIRFPNGTIQYQAATAGAGDAVLASTQTFSGINTFTSQVKISSGSPSNGMIAAAADTEGTIKWVQPGQVDPPGVWTCTIRTAACLATFDCPATASCSGNEKVITGGCYSSNMNPVIWRADRPDNQGWTCIAQCAAGCAATAYANCCY